GTCPPPWSWSWTQSTQHPSRGWPSPSSGLEKALHALLKALAIEGSGKSFLEIGDRISALDRILPGLVHGGPQPSIPSCLSHTTPSPAPKAAGASVLSRIVTLRLGLKKE